MGTAESHLFGIAQVKIGFFAAQKMRVTLTWMRARFVWTTWLVQCVMFENNFSLLDYLFGYFLFIFCSQSNKKKMRLLFLFNPYFSSHAHKDKNDTKRSKSGLKHSLVFYKERNKRKRTIMEHSKKYIYI